MLDLNFGIFFMLNNTTKSSVQSVELDLIAQLCDQLSDVVFFAKNRLGRYLTVNQTLVERSGFGHRNELIGKLPTELFGTDLGTSFERQDIAVLSSSQTISQRLELHVYANKSVGWCLTSKLAVKDENMAVIGLIGISQDIRSPNMSRAEYEEVSKVVEWILNHLDCIHSIKQIVDKTGLSQFRLNQRFRAVFGLNIGQWIIKQRIDRAQALLADSNTPIAEVALIAGYSDQSAFTRQFRLSTGLTPRKFRKVTGSVQ